MKQLILILFLSCSTILMGQYKPLIDENKEWVISYSYYDHQQSPLPAQETYYFSYFQSDTLINSVSYKKLFHQRFYLSTYYFGPSFPYINDTLQAPDLVAFLREDTISQKVFIIHNRPPPLAPEELLFDFSLNQGDTLYNYISTFSTNPPIIDSLSELMLNNNDTCKLLFLDGTQPAIINNLTTNYMIEGIGGPGGIRNPFYMVSVSLADELTQISCYSENGIQLFGDCNYPNFTNSAQEFSNSALINIKPNPTSGIITISLEEGTAKAISIKNNLGQIMPSEKHSSTKQLKLDISAYPNGIYFLQIETNKGIITKKIIKN